MIVDQDLGDGEEEHSGATSYDEADEGTTDSGDLVGDLQ